jgi:viroplasmin and RNaseH domain-containing protein
VNGFLKNNYKAFKMREEAKENYFKILEEEQPKCR